MGRYAAILKEFDHPLWKAIEAQSAGAGHGGMDYIEDYRLIQCLREDLRAQDKSTAENFAKNDPYVKEGLVKNWKVRPWTVVVGQDPSETPPGLPTPDP